MLKVVYFLIAAVIGTIHSFDVPETTAFSSETLEEAILSAELEADTFACPQFDQIASYLTFGLSQETVSCSPFVWTDVEHFELLGTFPVQYVDMFDVEVQAEIGDAAVEVFRIKVGGVQLFAIRDLIDEHAFDQQIGLLGNTVYEVWEDQSAQI